MILNLIKQYANILIALAIASVTFYLSSLYYNHKIDKINNEYSIYRITTEKNIEAQKTSILTQQNKLKDENIALGNKLKEVENEKFKTYTALQKANNDLKLSLANGSERLYINANCPRPANNSGSETKDSTTSSMDDGKTSKAVIDSGDAQSIISITEKADKYKSQLEALQEWVDLLILENNK